MPTLPMTVCASSSCRSLTSAGRCDTHRRVREQERGSACSRGYGRRHQAWRIQVLQRDLFTCVQCGRLPLDMSELEADHITPIKDGGIQYDLVNGQTLCSACHARKTQRES